MEHDTNFCKGNNNYKEEKVVGAPRQLKTLTDCPDKRPSHGGKFVDIWVFIMWEYSLSLHLNFVN
jgi:hypothetical protein